LYSTNKETKLFLSAIILDEGVDPYSRTATYYKLKIKEVFNEEVTEQQILDSLWDLVGTEQEEEVIIYPDDNLEGI